MKKLLTFLCSVAMALALSAPVFAQKTSTTTKPGTMTYGQTTTSKKKNKKNNKKNKKDTKNKKWKKGTSSTTTTGTPQK